MASEVNINELLPDEVLLQIFDDLDYPDLASVAQVCKLWRKISSDSTLWKRHSLALMPQFKKPMKGRTWVQHFITNYPAMKIQQIHFIRGVIYSAWGKAICAWKRNIFGGTFACHTTDTDHQGSITTFTVRFLGMITEMYTGSTDNTIKVWSRIRPEYHLNLRQTLKGHKTPITQVKAVDGGFISTDMEGNLFYWKKSLHHLFYELNTKVSAHSSIITHACVDKVPLHNTLFTASLDKTIKVWRLSLTGIALQQTIQIGEAKIASMEIPNRSQELLVGFEDGTVRKWKKNEESKFVPKGSFKAHEGPVRAIHFSKDKKYLLTSSDGCVKSWLREVSDEKEHYSVRNMYLNEKDERVTAIQTSLSPQQKRLKDIYYLSCNQLTQLSLQAGGGRVTRSTLPITVPNPLVPTTNVPYKSELYTPR